MKSKIIKIISNPHFILELNKDELNPIMAELNNFSDDKGYFFAHYIIQKFFTDQININILYSLKKAGLNFNIKSTNNEKTTPLLYTIKEQPESISIKKFKELEQLNLDFTQKDNLNCGMLFYLTSNAPNLIQHKTNYKENKKDKNIQLFMKTIKYIIKQNPFLLDDPNNHNDVYLNILPAFKKDVVFDLEKMGLKWQPSFITDNAILMDFFDQFKYMEFHREEAIAQITGNPFSSSIHLEECMETLNFIFSQPFNINFDNTSFDYNPEGRDSDVTDYYFNGLDLIAYYNENLLLQIFDNEKFGLNSVNLERYIQSSPFMNEENESYNEKAFNLIKTKQENLKLQKYTSNTKYDKKQFL